MKPKSIKMKKKRMDIDAFIEDELNNLNMAGGGKPASIARPGLKTKKKNPVLIKPSFASNMIKKREPLQEEPLEINEPMPEEKSIKKIKKVPFMPTKIKPKPGMQPI